MRYYHLILPALFWSSFSYGQNLSSTSRQTTKVISPMTVYGKTFSIKDFVFENGDSSIVNSVNTVVFDSVRLHSEDVEIVDSETGLTIIVFSENRLRSIKRQELQNTSTH